MDANPAPLDSPSQKPPAPTQITTSRIVLLVLLFVAMAALLFDLVARKRYNKGYQTVKDKLVDLREPEKTPEKIHELIGREPDKPLEAKAGSEYYTYPGIFYRYQVIVHYDESGLYGGIEQRQKFILSGG